MTMQQWPEWITNVGFPVTVALVLLAYVLRLNGQRLDKMEEALKELKELLGSRHTR
ncbi:hypothetical protein Q5741_11590 [Paenibacillus sp. JX-17]|uniref:YvrJ family protein n=1 Tax=Paenibacillus lacisoli TaxID=3064525 RepID=A0ABT9CEJ9_9BACL|nr:hypothetical protein [Paenibacillus sp. JX-17]MDO7907059.1 hypothetical protein [Paenibacillus sp. JX-17]